MILGGVARSRPGAFRAGCGSSKVGRLDDSRCDDKRDGPQRSPQQVGDDVPDLRGPPRYETLVELVRDAVEGTSDRDPEE